MKSDASPATQDTLPLASEQVSSSASALVKTLAENRAISSAEIRYIRMRHFLAIEPERTAVVVLKCSGLV